VKTYKDYIDVIDKANLLNASTHRQIHYYECEWIAHYMDMHPPANILEIGRNRGHSLGLFRFLAPDANIVSVDPKRYPAAVQMADYFSRYSSSTCDLIDGTIDDVDKEQWKGKFDFVLIDGNHHYKAVKNDWDIVSRHLVHKDTCVVFDNLHIPAINRVFTDIRRGHKKVRPCLVPGMDSKGTFGVVYVNDTYMGTTHG